MRVLTEFTWGSTTYPFPITNILDDIATSPHQCLSIEGKLHMSELLDFPTCYVCRSVELEIVINDDFGPMTTCGECGYSWISKYEELETPLLINKAS